MWLRIFQKPSEVFEQMVFHKVGVTPKNILVHLNFTCYLYPSTHMQANLHVVQNHCFRQNSLFDQYYIMWLRIFQKPSEVFEQIVFHKVGVTQMNILVLLNFTCYLQPSAQMQPHMYMLYKTAAYLKLTFRPI